jgi:hypothetical protein
LIHALEAVAGTEGDTQLAGAIRVAYETAIGRIVVTDSFTHCDARVSGRDVIVGGSFAGRLAFSLAFEHGARALIAHAAGVGKDEAGIAGLLEADRRGIPAAAVETMSARIGDGESVWGDGVVAHVNETARRLGVHPRMRVPDAAQRFLAAPEGAATPGVVDTSRRVALHTEEGRVVLMGSSSFATRENRRDVLCVGSHAGHVNALALLATPVRGVIAHDAGFARDGSGISGLPLLAEHGIAAAAVAAASACIGDPESTWETGVISAANALAEDAGVGIGMRVRDAAVLLLKPPSGRAIVRA